MNYCIVYDMVMIIHLVYEYKLQREITLLPAISLAALFEVQQIATYQYDLINLYL